MSNYVYFFSTSNHENTFNLINLKNPIRIEKLEHVECLCDKIIPIVKFEKLHIYFETKVVGGILG
jgi:hypothetical protein